MKFRRLWLLYPLFHNTSFCWVHQKKSIPLCTLTSSHILFMHSLSSHHHNPGRFLSSCQLCILADFQTPLGKKAFPKSWQSRWSRIGRVTRLKLTFDLTRPAWIGPVTVCHTCADDSDCRRLKANLSKASASCWKVKAALGAGPWCGRPVSCDVSCKPRPGTEIGCAWTKCWWNSSSCLAETRMPLGWGWKLWMWVWRSLVCRGCCTWPRFWSWGRWPHTARSRSGRRCAPRTAQLTSRGRFCDRVDKWYWPAHSCWPPVRWLSHRWRDRRRLSGTGG